MKVEFQNMRKGDLIMALAKIAPIDNFPLSKNMKVMTRFLGLYLNNNNVLFVWGNAQQKRFEKLKYAISHPPVLSLPQFYESGCSVLLQRKCGEFKPVAFASRTLTGTEQVNIMYLTEALTSIYGVENFAAYLQHSEFDLITDNEALTWLFSHPCQLGKLGSGS
ncbi:hypothetical protein PR048_012262 [Dryococelus australis]|uniref:Reverse transcriptase RNase H-like domain-containing protein n=1 Tax=Dryococelus australis TaxID=614101 RepID=A0ABQ9HPL7_9NEOP|nr:hypothetical protein PR048_012262 [Dryococelus australis]